MMGAGLRIRWKRPVASTMKLSELPAHQPVPALRRPGRIVARFPRNGSGRDFRGGATFTGCLPTCVPFSTRSGSIRTPTACSPSATSSTAAPIRPRPSSGWNSRGFHACRGNHEQFAIDSVDPLQYDLWINYNGGEWWLDLDEASHERFREAFANLPLAMEVETASGTVGIVHADVPPLMAWSRFMELLLSRDRDAALYAIWSRNRVQSNGSRAPVGGGVERVYCGHTPTRSTLQIDNVHYIDTGAVYAYEGYTGARLTMVQIHPEENVEYTIPTVPPR